MLKLIKFDILNENHLSLQKRIINDLEIQNNVITLNHADNNTYVINVDSLNVGMVKINKELNECYSIDIGILSEYRNNKYGTKTFNEIENVLKESWKKIILRTSSDNKSLITSAHNSGFSFDIDETEKALEEGIGCIVLSKQNINYKIKSKIKT